MEEPPEGGAKFEIEAKLGEIQTREEHTRLRMPVLTECLIDKNNPSLTQTRFESSMTVVSNYIASLKGDQTNQSLRPSTSI